MATVVIPPDAARQALALAARTSSITRALSGSYATRAGLKIASRAAKDAEAAAKAIRAQVLRMRREIPRTA